MDYIKYTKIYQTISNFSTHLWIKRACQPRMSHGKENAHLYTIAI